jgi:multidrug resistance efflux pump
MTEPGSLPPATPHPTVRAPIDGVIGRITLQPGDFLATGQAAMPPVATKAL